MTILALMNFNLEGLGYAAAVPRMVDTLIGCALAWFGVKFYLPRLEIPSFITHDSPLTHRAMWLFGRSD